MDEGRTHPDRTDADPPGPNDLARFDLARQRWPDLGGCAEFDGAAPPIVRTTHDHTSLRRPIVLLVPIGACEQHGPHLPLATDTLIARALAFGCCAKLEKRWRPLVAPAVAISASGEHRGFPGTLSLGVEATTQALIELARSADWADRIVFVNGHGGNTTALRHAVDRCVRDGRTWVSGWSPNLTGIDDAQWDLHAGWIETSLMLYLHPELVDGGSLAAGPERIDLDVLMRDGIGAVSSNGVIGDPTAARAETGHELLARWVAQLETHVEDENR